MNGNIAQIKANPHGSKTFGFIFGEDGEEYFFHKSALTNCTIFQIEEGDCVEFEIEHTTTGRPQAIHIRKKYSSIGDTITSNVNPGINASADIMQYNESEQMIIRKFGEALYVTNGGGNIMVGGSLYHYVLAKPTQEYTVLFNMTREIPIVFSDYISFEPRSLDVAAAVADKLQSRLRLDRSCHILVSNDSNIETRISELLKDSNLNSIVVPFSYREFLSGEITTDKIKERFRKYLFDADLFSASKPIQNDVFFFGRRDYARDIADKCKRASRCGIFGLRRSGKTSMLFAVKRILENDNYPVVFIPCQSELLSLNWKAALYQVVCDIKRTTNYLGSDLHTEEDYKKNTANISFIQDVDTMLEHYSNPVTLMFDEIESITFGVASSGSLWRSGDSFTQFWHVIRGYCTQRPSRLSIVIAGTNPMINEVPAFGEDQIPNPMFGDLAASNQGAYLKPFDAESTSVMINTLGGYMGIKFTDAIAMRLTEDCGGHPYLIRLLCGQINQYIREQRIKRPVEVSKGIYDKALLSFEKSGNAEGFYLMILNILQSCYMKEYNALKILATEGDAQLSQTLDHTALLHLQGYGLVEDNAGNLAIRFDTIKRFLQGKYKFERQNMSIEEQKQEINVRFDAAEQKMRSIIKDTLRTALGVTRATHVFLNSMRKVKAVHPNTITKAEGLTYKQLFDPTVNDGCFFSVLINAISENYTLFANVFEADSSTVIDNLWKLNKARRLPSHSAPENAEKWTHNDFLEFRETISWLEKILANYD